MIAGHRIAVVVPARDEARHIARVVGTMPGFVDEIVVVDDHSGDDTAGLARAAGATVVQHDRCRGVGAAIITGYRVADADIVAVMAGDGQMDPADLRHLVAPLVEGKADYCKGNRLRHHSVIAAMPWSRLVGTAVLGRLTSWAIGVPLGDSQCGYTAITRQALQRIDLAAVWSRYGYPNDLLGLVATSGARIAEVTVRPVYADEHSGLRAYHVATIGWLIARAYYRRLSRRRAA